MSEIGTELFEELRDLDIRLLEATVPTPGDLSGYPNPRLSLTQNGQVRPFRVVVLQNQYLRATIAPELGGRILEIIHSPSGSTSWPVPQKLVCEHRHGQLIMPVGLEFRLDRQRPSVSALGPVDTYMGERDEDRPVLWVAWHDLELGISVQHLFNLEPDKAYLDIQTRCFNRDSTVTSYDPVWVLHGVEEAWGAEDQRAVQTHAAQFEFVSLFDSCWCDGASLNLAKFADGFNGSLAPRQTDGTRLRIHAFKRCDELCEFGPGIVLAKNGDQLELQSSSDLKQIKVALKTVDGQVMEAPIAEVLPDQSATLALGSLEPSEFAILDASRNSLIGESSLLHAWSALVPDLPAFPVLPQDLPNIALERAGVSPILQSQAHTQLAVRCLEVGEFAKADEHLDIALLTRSDDPLLWWAKAMVFRRTNEEAEAENHSLLNAHFLSPLEPMLRVESFLSQSHEMGSEGHPLIRPLADYPALLIETAHCLIEHRLFEDAGRFLDEAVRHENLMFLRLQWAACYLLRSKMETEAAQQLQLAEEIGWSLPLPTKRQAAIVLPVLLDRFPYTKLLQNLAEATQITKSP